MYIDLIQPNSDKGFNCPYLLFIPNSNCSGKHLVLEMGNPRVSYSIKESIKSQVDEFICGGPFISSYKQALINSSSPMIMPIFPRPIVKEGKDSDVCVIEFNHTSLNTDYSLLKRMDLQTIAMVNDAKERLREKGIDVLDKLILTGYSSSAQFALRFSVVYPEMIHAVIAGGFNGLGTLPVSEVDGKMANFPIGINDIESKFGKKFNSKEFATIKHYLYMGLDDRHAYHKPFTVGNEATEFVESVFSGDIIDGRLKKYLSIMEQNTKVQFFAIPNCDHYIGAKMARDESFRKFFESTFSKVLSDNQKNNEQEK